MRNPLPFLLAPAAKFALVVPMPGVLAHERKDRRIRIPVLPRYRD